MERTADTNDRKEKKGTPKSLLLRTWRKCLSMRRSGTCSRSISTKFDGSAARAPKAETWTRRQVTREGCFSVCVGPEKEKYVIRTECLNHPLFRLLLDEAEMVYGYDVDGPLLLPCDVDHFKNVLSEVEHDEDGYDPAAVRRPTCNFAYNTYQLLSPARLAMVYRSGHY